MKTSEPSMGMRAVGQSRPGGFVVGLDGGPVLGERELEADVGVGVAVGEVMHDLAHGPAAVAIGRVELGVVEAADRGAQGARAAGAGFQCARRGAADRCGSAETPMG